MTINSVALITGALGFSAALVWNKAVSEILESMIPNKSAVFQAIVTTILIIIIVYIVNLYINAFNIITNSNLKDSTIESGGSAESRVRLLN
jgi:hypothetical protein